MKQASQKESLINFIFCSILFRFWCSLNGQQHVHVVNVAEHTLPWYSPMHVHRMALRGDEIHHGMGIADDSFTLLELTYNITPPISGHVSHFKAAQQASMNIMQLISHD